MGRIPGWQTQAVYHTVAELMTEETPDTIIISQPSDTYVCLGYHQKLDHVFDQKVCVEKEIPILRRKVGGGGTYLDSNQLFYQCVFHQSRVPKDSKKVYEQMLTPVVNTLKHFFDVNIIPHTLKSTTFNKIKMGELLNIEVDMIARYVCNYLNCK